MSEREQKEKYLNLVDRVESRAFAYLSIRKPLNQKYNF